MTEIENKSTMGKIRLGMQLRDRDPTEHARGPKVQPSALKTEGGRKKGRERGRGEGGEEKKQKSENASGKICFSNVNSSFVKVRKDDVSVSVSLAQDCLSS